MSETKIKNKIVDIIKDHLAINLDDSNLNKEFTELGADSLDIVEIIIAVEYEFDISIPESECDKLTSPESLISYVTKLA